MYNIYNIYSAYIHTYIHTYIHLCAQMLQNKNTCFGIGCGPAVNV